MDFTNPHFAEPGWLWLAGLGPLLLLALDRFATRARRRQAQRLASARFLAELTRSLSPGRRRVKRGLLLAAVAGFGLTLARPQWGEQPEPSLAMAEDIVILLDCSRSMLAEDVRPSRLERAKLAIQDFIAAHPAGRIGLVAFAGQAFLQCPLTFDHEALGEALASLNTKSIPVAGTDLGRALEEAAQAMAKAAPRKVLIVVTDGEDLERSGIVAARKLAEAGVVVYTVGVGSPEGTEIPVVNEHGQADVVRNTSGQPVRSKLDEETLRAVAKAAGGSYHPLGPLGEGLMEVELQMDAGRAIGGRGGVGVGVDRFHVPLGLLTLFLVAESLLGTRRRERPTAARTRSS